MTFGVIIHRTGASWNAYVPELPGVVAAAGTRERVIELIAQAIPLHLEDAKLPARSGESEALTIAISA